ncbi:hypothetical protein VNO80_20757 [Phaseolus coccineus]|uniref:Uncharacterized protein n=1 Tax=Phaseolus coccineus TaxID=3886 RepID=A0AAN9M1U3_PHACN
MLFRGLLQLLILLPKLLLSIQGLIHPLLRILILSFLLMLYESFVHSFIDVTHNRVSPCHYSYFSFISLLPPIIQFKSSHFSSFPSAICAPPKPQIRHNHRERERY